MTFHPISGRCFLRHASCSCQANKLAIEIGLRKRVDIDEVAYKNNRNYFHVFRTRTSCKDEDAGDFDLTGDGTSEDLGTQFVQDIPDVVFDNDPEGHKMGFVAIIGRPNAGKSTLLNQILGEQLSIVTEKAQTTRHKILGIWSEEGHQVAFLDTPGIITKQRDELEERMMAAVNQAIQDADALIAIVDVTDRPQEALEMIQPGADWNGPPMLVLLNKMDSIDVEEGGKLVEWYQENCNASMTLPISALEGQNVNAVREWVLGNIPVGPSLYPKDILSESSQRFFVSEIIRKHVFLQYRQELPYQVTVEVVDFKERRPPTKTYIAANVVVEKERHVKLLVGAKGSAIKNLSAASREEIEAFLGLQVYLELSVKVVPDWRKDEKQLGRFGYQ
eukprot:jgi/Picsp_1/5329/NSC_02690-R1_gtp-binding protein era